MKAVCLSTKTLILPMLAFGLHRQCCSFSGRTQSSSFWRVFELPTRFIIQGPPAGSFRPLHMLVLDSTGIQPTSAEYCRELRSAFMTLHCRGCERLFACSIRCSFFADVSSWRFQQHLQFTSSHVNLLSFVAISIIARAYTSGHASSSAFLSVFLMSLQFVVPVEAAGPLSDLFRRRSWIRTEANLHRRRTAGELHLFSWPCACLI